MHNLIIALFFGLLGFGLGRVHHPASLKVSAIKAEIVKLEAELSAEVFSVSAAAKAEVAKVVATIKSYL